MYRKKILSNWCGRRGEWSRRMIQRGSLLKQLFTLITLMKHLISQRVLQADGVWPLLVPSSTRILFHSHPIVAFLDSSSPTLLPRHYPILRPPPRHAHSFALAKAARLIIYSYVSTENPPAVPTLITAPRLGLFTPVGSYLCVLPG